MLKSKKYPYLNSVDSKALFAQCEKNGQKDNLSILTQYLHNRKYMTQEGKENALSFISGQVLGNNEGNDGFMNDNPLELYFKEFFDVPFPEPEKPKFTFIDLFAVFCSFRLAMLAQGGKCIFSSEWNQYAQKTYMANFGDMPFGDITKEETKSFIPERFDVLCAGLPRQPLSIAGVSKKNSLGRETGFKDKTQGTLFFDVADIISRHRPKAFFLENVKNLVSHDKGRTFKVITETLEELDYSIHYKVLDGKSFVPQHRERIMIVGYDRKLYGGKEKFEFPNLGEPVNCIGDILEQDVPDKYTLSDKLWGYLQNYAQKHREKGNGFGFGLVDLNGITRTLSARYYKDGSEILIPQGDGIKAHLQSSVFKLSKDLIDSIHEEGIVAYTS